MFWFFREIQRLVYVPFMGTSVMGTTAEEVAAHVAIKRMIYKGDLSSSIGAFVQLGTRFLITGMGEIVETYIPWIATNLEGCLPNPSICYNNVV